MDRIFHHDDTMYEAATKIYVKSGAGYIDEACKTAVTAAQMADIFYRGMVIVDTKIEYLPTSLTNETDGKVTIGYIKAVTASGATTATPATVKSA